MTNGKILVAALDCSPAGPVKSIFPKGAGWFLIAKTLWRELADAGDRVIERSGHRAIEKKDHPMTR
jgi:hypothetical protein